MPQNDRPSLDAAQLKLLLIKFIKNSILITKNPNAASLKTNDYTGEIYKGLSLKASFGQGNFTEVPWIGFLNFGQTIQAGIYPVLLYSRIRRENNFEICFGVSATNAPTKNWEKEIVDGLPHSSSSKYPESFVHRAFTINSEGDFARHADEIFASLDAVIEQFSNQFQNEDSGGFNEASKLYKAENVAFLIKTLKDIVESAGLRSDDKRIVFSTSRRRFQFTVGQRYCLTLWEEDAVEGFGVTTKGKINEKSSEFDGKPAAFFTSSLTRPQVEELLPELKRKIDEELGRTTVSSFKKYDDPLFRAAVFGNRIDVKREEEKMSRSNDLESLNTIFYGPPGTGKTKLATDLLLDFERQYRANESVNIDSFIQDLSWWQLFALVIDDLGGVEVKVTQIVGHRFTKVKLASSNNKSIVATIWGQLQSHTSPDSDTVKTRVRQAPFIFRKNGDSAWSLTDNWKNDLADVIEGFDSAKKSQTVNPKNTRFVTFHQSYSYEDFIEGIKPRTNEEGDLYYEVEPGSFKEFCDKARIDRDNKYLFVIDEINRGNISKIFGEFITLIEDSKREGEEYCVPVELQYSKVPFTVPKNVYIVGTMNTADRSIATLDLALRRRFSFKPLYPDGGMVQDVGSIKLKSVFAKLNKKIRVVVGDDYQLGHTFFLGLGSDVSKLKGVWFNRILPLLNEYFYGDFVRLKALVPTFVHEEKVEIDLEDEKEKVIHRLKVAGDYPNNDKFIEDLNSIQ